ncbi:uncharacterized protein F4812DRAFT_132805 [Daldinia caldariorum]|uniref:uncharacterized protein n=1 Tax=Daldinia caldariorum TaxID=326644 RepID=UPI0020087C38|nr:uncharacterized protein F4812DRAFT_132805 [Daldinia caldariorum]KAI1465115.1 hypothetical protein F4812DRAFT_132805 [Daldinia caldariorum]
MLEGMRCLKGRRSDKPSATTGKISKKPLNKTCLFKYWPGNRKKGAPGQSFTRSEQPPNLNVAVLDQATILGDHDMDRDMDHDVDKETFIQSFENTRNSPVEQWLVTSAIPSSYQEFQLRETTVQGSVPSKFPDDFSSRSHSSLKTRPSTLLGETRPRFQDHTELATEHSTGLSALFQQPARLGSDTRSYPNRLKNYPSSSSSTNPPSLTFLSLTPSTSCSSLKPEVTIRQSKSAAESTNSLRAKADEDAELANSLSHRIALAQVFMYQARMSDRPLNTPFAISGGHMLS